MLLRHALLVLTLASAVSACRHNAPADPSPKLIDPPAAKDPAPPAFLKGLSVQDYVAIMGAAGCKDPKADAATCAMCPDASPTSVELFPGDFTAPGRRGVVVSAPACKPESSDTPTMRLQLVEMDDKGVWSVAAKGRATHLTGCRGVADSAGRSHLLCVAKIEHYGTTSTYHAHIGWTTGQAEPVQTTLIEVAERDNCALNYSVAHEIKGPTFEAAEDGSHLVVEVTTTMGPFTKALGKCPEEGFQGPLKPERTPKTLKNKFTFTLTPEGPRERTGKGTYISLGAEFEELMEQ